MTDSRNTHQPDDKQATTESNNDTSTTTTPASEISVSLLITRGAIGGVLMGLANLVPGISGGTMLVAAGIYHRFINAIAEVTTFKFRLPSLVLLASVVGTALLAILLLAGTVKELVVEYRWVMYSLFIGLTLGGIPVIWRMIGKADRRVWTGAVIGFGAMAVLAWMQCAGIGEAGDSDKSFAMLLIAGLAGASAMILPGVSGGYLLLVLGQYVVILSGIDAIRSAMHERDLEAMWLPMTDIALPVGIGVVIGIVVVSQLLRWLLRRCELVTLGFLLGLLAGAVVGLWPFETGVEPLAGQIIRGQVMTPELIAAMKPEHWPTEYFTPTVGEITGSLGLIIVGFAMTSIVSYIGGGKKST